MANEILTKADVAKAATPGKLYDGGGLILDVRSATSASWLYKFTFGGKPDECGLGSRAKVTLEQARDLRRWCELEVLADRNPRLTRKATKLEIIRAVNAPKADSIAVLIRQNIRLIAPEAKSLRQQQAWITSLQFARIGRIARLLPNEVTREDCRQMLQDFYDRAPVMADDIRQRLAAVLSWAKANDLILTPNWENPARWDDNMRWRLDRGDHVETAHASLTPAEVPAFLSKVRPLQAAQMPALALEWIIISACRANEGAFARWDEIDLDNDCWVIPVERLKVKKRGKKVAEPHRVPLTARHHEILALLKGRGGEHLFEIRKGKGASVTGVRRVLHKVHGGQDGITIHGFRASFKTWAEDQTVEVAQPFGPAINMRLYGEELVERSLCHVKHDPYSRGDKLELRRPVLEAWAAHCTSQGVVVPLRRRPAKAA